MTDINPDERRPIAGDRVRWSSAGKWHLAIDEFSVRCGMGGWPLSCRSKDRPDISTTEDVTCNACLQFLQRDRARYEAQVPIVLRPRRAQTAKG